MTQVDRDPFPRPKPRRLYGKQRVPRSDLEGAVLKECKALLAALPQVLYFERRNTGAVAFEDGSRIAFGSKGAADLWCLMKHPKGCIDPIHVEIECKRRDGKGRLSPDQEAFARLMGGIGVFHITVTSAADLENKLREIGFIP